MLSRVWPKGRRDKKDLLFVLLVAFLPLLQFLIFYIGVNANSFLLAFKSYDSATSFSFVGFANFVALFKDFSSFTFYLVALKNSALVFGIGMPVSLGLALFFSYYIYKRQGGLGDFFKMMLFLPSIIPSIALATMFVQLTDSAFPKLVKMLFNQDVVGLFQNPQLTIYTIIFYNIWCSFGVNVLLLLNAMSAVPASTIEAAKIDGTNFFQEFAHVVFPQIFPTVKTLFLISLGSFFVNSASIVSFYGTKAEESVYTIGYYIYVQAVLNASSPSALPKLAALGILLTLITMPLVYLGKFLLDRFGPSEESR